jgi:hypothetical protein
MYVGRAAPGGGGGGGGGSGDILTVRPQPGILKSIHANNIVDTNICPGNTCWFSRQDGQNGPWKNWCGGVFAAGYSTHGAMLYQGGGHFGGDGTQITGFDLTTRQWFSLGTNPPTDYLDQLDLNWCDFPWNGGHIVPATHTYSNPFYVAPQYAGNTRGKWVLPYNVYGPDVRGANGNLQPHAVDLDTGVQERFTTNHMTPAGMDGFGSSVVDTNRGIAWCMNGSYGLNNAKIDLTQTTKTLVAESTFYASGWNHCARYVPSTDFIVAMYCAYQQNALLMNIFDVSSGTPVGVAFTTPPGTPTMVHGSGFGFDWCPDTGKFYVYEGFGTTTLYVLTPPALRANWTNGSLWTWSTETMGGETPTAMTELFTSGGGDSVFSKWMYNPHPDVKCFMWSQGTVARTSPDGVSRPGAFQLYRPLGT